MKWSLVPSKKMTFRSNLSKQEVLQRITAELASRATGSPVSRFVGEVQESSFRVWEVYRHRGNSFSPTVEGVIVSDETGTLIHIVMRMTGCVFIFVLLWCYVPVLLLFLSVLTYIREGTLNTVPLVALGAIAFMVMMTILGFRAGIKTARAFLSEVLGTFEEL